MVTQLGSHYSRLQEVQMPGRLPVRNAAELIERWRCRRRLIRLELVKLSVGDELVNMESMDLVLIYPWL